MSTLPRDVDRMTGPAGSSNEEAPGLAAGESTPASASPDRPVRSDTGAPLAYHRRPGAGLSVINPLSYGVTIDGVAAADGQEVFLDAVGSGFDLVTYDQRGAGRSAHAGVPAGWEELGADLWRVADAAGIERAVLYGVADGGYTIAHATRLHPERVLGVIFNFVPPKFAADPGSTVGIPRDLAARWFAEAPAAGDANPLEMLEGFGIGAGDARALAEHWLSSAEPAAAKRRRELMSAADIRALLPAIDQPTLVMQPARRELFRGWGDAMVAALPHARIVYPPRGIEAIGAIHAFLAVLTSDLGREASRLSPELSATVQSSEQSVGNLQRIAVAVDDDVVSGRAVELACRLGEAQKAEIILIHVIEVPHTLSLDQPPAEAVRRAERALELGKAIVDRHRFTSCKSRLITGRSVAGSLVHTAEEEGADLIVVSDPESGSHGPRSAVASEVMRRAPGKVLVNSGRVE